MILCNLGCTHEEAHEIGKPWNTPKYFTRRLFRKNIWCLGNYCLFWIIRRPLYAIYLIKLYLTNFQEI